MLVGPCRTSLLPNFSWKIVSWYTKENRFSVRPSRLPILMKQVTRDKFQGYFEDKLKTINTTTQALLKEIGTFKSDIASVQRLLGNALDTHYSTFKDLEPKSLVYLLVAVNMHGHERITKHRRMIMEFLIRQDFELLEMDSIMIHCLIDAYSDLTKQYGSRKKLQHTTFSFLSVLQRNFEKVDPQHYPFLVDLLTDDLTNKVTYLRFARTLQSFLDRILREVVSGNNLKPGIKKMIDSQSFIPKVELMYCYFNCSQEQADTLFKLVYDYVLEQRLERQKLQIDYILTVLRNFPARERGADGICYKRKIFEKLFQYLHKIDFCDSKEYVYNRYHFCSSVLHFYFYEHWVNLTFAQKEDLIFLERTELKGPPELPKLFWNIYEKYPWLVHQTLWLRDTIKDCYPDKYKSSEQNIAKDTREPIFQTEMRIRMEMALMKLKIKFEKEVKVSNRFVDFLLEDNIILELDGTLHFQAHYFENDDVTCYRNLHLLLAGYRLIVISIHEYNLYRETDELAELFLKKLALLREEDCLAVL